jgi:uncharacterized protein YkwD
MRKSTIGTRVLLALSAVSLALSVTPQIAYADASNPVADEQIFVDQINKTRAEANLPPLTVHPGLVEVARKWSDQMRQTYTGAGAPERCIISHNPNLKDVLPKQWVGLGENVGCGNIAAEEIHVKFVESKHHYENMVNPKFDMVGIGIVYEKDIMFVTEQFMDSVETPAAAPNELALTAGQKDTKDSKVLSASIKAPVAKKTTKPKKVRKTKKTAPVNPAAAPLS